jgi:transposase
MASVIKKRVKGRTYYYVAESKRVDGKPRMVKQWYLGSVEKLIALAEGNVDKEEPRQIDCVEEGAVATLVGIAKELGIRDAVNDQRPKRKQGMTVGDYVLLAALNRAIAATSKSKVKEWVDQTALHLYLDLDKDMLTSQNFWDHFNKLSEKDVEKIGDSVALRAVELEKVPLDCLVYDTTNYYNYWDVLNPSELAKMTKSKAGKDQLRHIGLAVAVDRNHGLPLFHRLYPANDHDSKVFRTLLDKLFAQINGAVSDKKAITFIFDKGNNSEGAIKRLDESRHHFVGTRSPFHHKDLCRIPLERYSETAIPDGDPMPIYETRLELYGKDRRVLLVYNEATYRRQLARMERHLELAKKELSFFKKRAKGADGRSTLESIERAGREITDRYHVTGLLELEVEEADEGYKVSARKNFAAIDDAKTRFGKQVVFSNRETITAGELAAIYRDRAIVEDVFRITKSDAWVKMNPAFHWTDSKIRVHALTCILALLLVRIAHKRAKAKGFAHGAERMMELLAGVRTAMVYYPKSTKPRRILCSLTNEQRALLTALDTTIPAVR